jgi:hypothetical protein
MSFKRALFALVIVGGTFAAQPGAFAAGDEVTPAQIALAAEAIHASQTTNSFDNVLPNLADMTQNRLIQVRPDLHEEISNAVQAAALKLVPRRTDLDRDVARIWAKAFTEDELKAIVAFYKSPAGQKLVTVGPKVAADSMNALKGWSDRVGEELYDKAREELKKQGYDF